MTTTHTKPMLHSIRASLSWSLPAEVGNYTLIGCSRAADKTAWVIPELSWYIDAGDIVKNLRPQQVFLTHTHSDHVNTLHRLTSRTMNPEIYVPRESLHYLNDMLCAMRSLSAQQRLDETHPDWISPYRLRPVEPGMELTFTRGKRVYVMRVIKTHHSVPSVGYLLFERRNKLKEEYLHLSGAEIGALRQKGVPITQERDYGIIAFLGDTSVEVFDTHPEVLEMPVIITDCSFIEPSHVDNARRTLHGHWLDIEPYVREYPENIFILSHFSWRYGPSDVEHFLGDRPDNALVWMDLDSGLSYTMKEGESA